MGAKGENLPRAGAGQSLTPADSSPPEVTVIIPTRDRIRFVDRAVRDALRQVDVDLEVLVVDDGSVDADAVRRIAHLDPRVRVIRHERSYGVARARNTGIARARGVWLAFFDDDDRWAPTKLRTQLDVAAQANASWVFGGALTIDEHDRVLFASRAQAPRVANWVGTANPVPGGCSNVLARAELVRAADGFDEQLSMLADWDLWIRLARRERPTVCPELLVGYRLHPDNMHIREIAAMDAELEHLARKYHTEGRELRRDLWLWPALPWLAKASRRAGRRTGAARLFFARWRQTHAARDLAQAMFSLVGEPMISAVRRLWMRGVLLRPEWLESETAGSHVAAAAISQR